MNFFILGCGRSGTSLVAGMMRNSGLFMGENSYSLRYSNPKGFFEDREINNLNEELLRPYLPSRCSHNGISYGSDMPSKGQRWLARIPSDIKIIAGPEEIEKIRNITRNSPFCFKDPRFCYTLECWKSEAETAKFIFVFRNPGDVVESILSEIKRMPYFNGFSISLEQAFETWRLINQYVLTNHATKGEWLFLNYDDLFKLSTLIRIENFVEMDIDRNFADISLNRSRSEYNLDALTVGVYNQLRERVI
jgi:hypothetical protein